MLTRSLSRFDSEKKSRETASLTRIFVTPQLERIFKLWDPSGILILKATSFHEKNLKCFLYTPGFDSVLVTCIFLQSREEYLAWPPVSLNNKTIFKFDHILTFYKKQKLSAIL